MFSIVSYGDGYEVLAQDFQTIDEAKNRISELLHSQFIELPDENEKYLYPRDISNPTTFESRVTFRPTDKRAVSLVIIETELSREELEAKLNPEKFKNVQQNPFEGLPLVEQADLLVNMSRRHSNRAERARFTRELFNS